MHITPLDIKKQPFRKTLMGFDPDQVNSFLEMVANEFEALIRQNNQQASQLKQTGERLEDYVKIEKTLNQTLLTAQKATDEARVNAQKEAELIIKDAQIRAHAYEDESRRRVHRLENELMSLKTQRDGFLSRFRALLQTQLEMLETLSTDLREGTRAAKHAAPADSTADAVSSQPDLAGGVTDDVVV
jgi:cell division initiation protein